MAVWLINSARKWVIDPITRKWKIGASGDPCCYRQATRCSDGQTVPLWMTSTDSAPISAFKYLAACYGFGPSAACLPAGATLLTPAQVQIFSSCSACTGPACIFCSFRRMRVLIQGATGACCSQMNGTWDCPWAPGATPPDACAFHRGPIPLTGCPSTVGSVAVNLYNQLGVQNIEVNALVDGSAGYNGKISGATVIDSLCSGTPAVVTLTRTSTACPTGGTVTATVTGFQE